MKKYFILLNLIIFIFYSCKPEQSLSESNEILEFIFLAENNSSLHRDYNGIIDGNIIFVTIPYGVDTEKLIASIETNANSIKVNNIIQESGVTINNFSETVLYDIIAENGNINTYTVEVSTQKSPLNEIIEFAFLAEKNPSLQNDYSSIIDGNNISITLPYDVYTEKLIASIETNANSIQINNIIQESGVTINNFSETVLYDAIAENGNINTYTVEVSTQKSPLNEIIEFTFLAEKNPSLQNDYSSIIDGNNISITLPYDVDTEKLIASIETNANSIQINNIIQESGVTINDFSETVLYDAIAENGNINTYTVEVNIENTNCIDNNPDYNPYTFNPENYECPDYYPEDQCPIVPTVTAKFERNKKIFFEPKDNDRQYLNTYSVNISEGDKNVFSYTYHYQGKYIDDFVYTTIVFEIDNNINEFLLSGRNLLNLNLFYHNASYYGPSGKVFAKKGCVKGVKINENEWQIDINVSFEIEIENEESRFAQKMISEIFTME